MTRNQTYPVQSRLLTEEEKRNAEARAKRNGLSLSALIRILLLKAEREDYRVDLGRPRKADG